VRPNGHQRWRVHRTALVHQDRPGRSRVGQQAGAQPASEAVAEPGPAVVYAHGGGMVLGTLDLYDELISWYVGRTGVPFLSVGYRRAPDEGSGTTLSQDVFAGLTWLLATASELGVDPARVAVMGDSGGGAPAAGAAILARDRGIALARQILGLSHARRPQPDPRPRSRSNCTYTPQSRTAGRDSPQTPSPPSVPWPTEPAPSPQSRRTNCPARRAALAQLRFVW
jgi:acetyl esterase/lipase